MAGYRARLEEFQKVLETDIVSLRKLRHLCFNGIPDDSGYRPLCWKLLLNYLPEERSIWTKTLEKQRSLYEHFIDEIVIAPGDAYGAIPKNNAHVSDHPLNPNPDSKWMSYFKDNEVLLQIDKDVRRLCPDMSFFQQSTDFPCKKLAESHHVENLRKRIQQTQLSSANVTRTRMGVTNICLSKKRAQEEYGRLEEGQEAHWEVVERILFIYAKLNPGQGYVQGMNEIIGPIYYNFASDPNIEWRTHAEADCFFCFTNLMSEIRDYFIKALDDSATGIGAMMARLMSLLKKHDSHLFLRLEQQELKPQFYSFRWITLLLSQEFPLPDVIRLWDSLLSDPNRFTFLIHVCCAMLCLLSKDLLVGDFPSNMKLLQNFPETDIHKVIAKAVELQR